jgi:hypothetical protein
MDIEEIAKASLELTPAQAAAAGATLERLDRIRCKDGIIIDWLDDAQLEAVPIGQLADRIIDFVQQRRSNRQTVTTWRERNRHALCEFWARAPSDALGISRRNSKGSDKGKGPRALPTQSWAPSVGRSPVRPKHAALRRLSGDERETSRRVLTAGAF